MDLTGLKSSIYNFQFNLRQQMVDKYYGFLKPPTKPIDIRSYQPKKVLFVFSGLLGDSIMSIPTILEARRLWQNANFTVLGKNHNKELIAIAPVIDKFYEFNADPFSIRKSKETKKLQSWLNRENFDAAIILNGDQFAHLLARANIPVRIGVKNAPLAHCLTHSYESVSPRICAINERLNALRCFGYEVENALPKLWVEAQARKSLREKLISFGLDDEEYVVMHPFGSTPKQWWNLDDVPTLARRINEKYKLKTLLVGKRYDLNGVEVVPPTKDNIDSSIINTTGKLTLQELLAAIESSKLVITTDSGPFHIAGALEKPMIGLFRARRPEHARHYPTAEVILGIDEGCQEKCKWNFCQSSPCRQLSNISADEVWHVVDEKLKPLTGK